MPRLFSSGLNSCPQTTPQSLLRVLQAALMKDSQTCALNRPLRVNESGGVDASRPTAADESHEAQVVEGAILSF
jgi:hypothetical protein